MLQPEVDAQCDKMAKVVNLDPPTTVASLSHWAFTFIELSWHHVPTVDVPLRNFLNPDFWTQFQSQKYPSVLEILEFSKIIENMSNEASSLIPSSICSTVSTERRLVIDIDQGRRQVKICGVDRYGERGARAYNGGLEAERPPYPTPPLVQTGRICINFRSDL